MSCFYGPRLTQLINSKGFHLSWESPMQTPSVTSTGELVMTIISHQQSSSLSSCISSWISSHMYISMISNTILPNSHFSVNYDFEEPEFDNITNEAKVSSLSLALNILWSLSSASWLSSPSSSQRLSSSSRSGFHLLSSDSATSSASDCCGQLATWLAAGWWWSSWWSQWSWWPWSWQ